MGMGKLNTKSKHQQVEQKGKQKHKKAKGPQPKKKSVQQADKIVRTKIASGELVKDELERVIQRDARSLYIRFAKDNLPREPEEIKKLHPDIKFVRTPRLNIKLKDENQKIHYAFVEFGNEAECKAAKNKLATTQYEGSELFVDFVGEKSRMKKVQDPKDKSQFNPTRLFISGLAKGVTKTNLKQMFPKCSQAEIPSNAKKKGTAYGFIQFSTPSDAKAAFDAAQGLEVNGFPITVLFAKRTSQKDEVVKKKKAEKRKALEAKKGTEVKEKKFKDSEKDEENNEEESEDDEEEDADDTLKEEDGDEDDENDDDSGDDENDVEDDDSKNENSDDNDNEDEDEDDSEEEDD